MKRYSYFLVLILSVSILTVQGQRILLVDNNPGAPADDGKVNSFVYNDLPSAVAAAMAGDILHIKPSPNDYGSVTINTDDISLVGIGFNPDKDLPITTNITRIDLDASNVRIAGLVVDVIEIAANGTISIDLSLTGISIEGCMVRQIFAAKETDDFVDNLIIRNCLLGNNIGTNNSNQAIDFDAQASNVIITNNVIVGSTGTSGLGSVTASGALIKNNLFVGNGASQRRGFANLANSTVSNNIFYGRSPVSSSSSSTNVFNSNVSVGVAAGDEVFPPAGVSNTDDGNNIQDYMGALFADANIVISDTWVLSWDPILDPGATSLIGMGTDGTDIGVTGSSLGYSTTGTPVPFIRIFNTSEVIKQGTDLQVTIEAQGN